MITIDRLRIRLSSAHRTKAREIARQVAEALARAGVARGGAHERLRLDPIRTSPAAEAGEIADLIVKRIHRSLAR